MGKAAMVVIGLAMMLSACDESQTTAEDGDKAESGTSNAKPTTMKEIRARMKAEAAEEGARTNKGGKKTWEVNVEGKPSLTGFAVMTSEVGGIKKYALLGADAMFYIDIQGEKQEPYAFHIGYVKSKIRCLYKADNKGDSRGITVSIADKAGKVRGDISGEITCQQTGDPSAPKETTKITGWFEK